jgi:phospholipid/cholesterol/gamma-HCH transport system substrate-binding protein
MERNANYALVGLISTILLIAMIVFAFWLANFVFSAKYDTYDVMFTGPVDGLTRGGDVHFNGIKVGEVSDIQLDAKDPNQVIAKISVRSDTPVRQDSIATLEPEGITGVSYIQITAGTTTMPLLKDSTTANPPMTIHAKAGGLSSLLASGGTVVQRAVDTLDNINKVLSPQNIQRFDAIMSDVQAVTAELRQRKAVIADADRALQNADQAAQQIRDLAKTTKNLVDANGQPTIKKVDDALDQVQGAAADLRSMIGKLQGPTSDFAANGLPQVTAALANLQTTTQNLNRLINEVEADPRAFINKPPAKQVEVKP